MLGEELRNERAGVLTPADNRGNESTEQAALAFTAFQDVRLRLAGKEISSHKMQDCLFHQEFQVNVFNFEDTRLMNSLGQFPPRGGFGIDAFQQRGCFFNVTSIR